MHCIAIVWVYFYFQMSGFLQVYHIKLEIFFVHGVVEITVGVNIRNHGGVICCRVLFFGSVSCVHWQNGGVFEGGDLIFISWEVGVGVTSDSRQCFMNFMIPSWSANGRYIELGQPKVPTHEVPFWVIHAHQPAKWVVVRPSGDACAFNFPAKCEGGPNPCDILLFGSLV